MPLVLTGVLVFVVGLILTNHWLPLGPEKGLFSMIYLLEEFNR